jgi:hypothetical protein
MEVNKTFHIKAVFRINNGKEKYIMDINSRRQRWINFYRQDGKTRFMLIAAYDKCKSKAPMLWYEKTKERIDWAYAAWDAAMEEARHVPDDYVPSLSVPTGTEIFAEAMGCKVHYPLDNNPFALPCVHSAAEVPKLKVPRWQDTRLSILFEMADKLRSLAGADTLMHLPDIQSPLDIAALVWDKNMFYASLIEEPDAVHELTGKCKQLLFSFLNDWFARYGTTYIAHYPDYYMEGGVTLSEDEIGAISPSMFREFALPTLKEMSEHFGGIGVHCCADSERQWENFKLIPNIKILNLHRPVKSQMDSWKDFNGHVALYPYPCGEGCDCYAWPGQYPVGSHAVLTVEAKERTEAKEKIERMRDIVYRL